jgi:hypothetical protein
MVNTRTERERSFPASDMAKTKRETVRRSFSVMCTKGIKGLEDFIPV